MTNTTKRAGPIEVWLRTAEGIGLVCTVVNADESTTELDVDSLSMRGAQREMTGYFIKEGYTPAGRWESTAGDPSSEILETMRVFKPAS